ncbi:MAG: hypothetical protein KG003_03955 [Bacteroidetes bacterium]|nr:hypothetical protein [Bacteroidota bacterium]
MCFSATASFGAGVILTGIGVASIRKTNKPSQKLFASIPLLFAVQQITEGFVWLSLSDPHYASLEKVTTYIFLFIAQVIWPAFVPYSIMQLEPQKKRNKMEYFLLALGVAVATYLGYCLVNFPVKAQIEGLHISYIQEYPYIVNRFSGIFYVMATVLPPFFSRIPRMWMLGSSILISYIITAVFYSDYVVSVWCFFASIISISIYVILFAFNHPNTQYSRTKKGSSDKPLVAS